MQEYRYRDSLVIGVDHGYGNMKTAHRVFPASVTEDPQYGASVLTYEAKSYGRHKDFRISKTLDPDYYLLTLAALAGNCASGESGRKTCSLRQDFRSTG